MLTLDSLRNTLPQTGRIVWLGARPARKEAMAVTDSLALDTAQGIVGDRYAGRSGERHVTLIQAEHLAMLPGLLTSGAEPVPQQTATIDPAVVRRNVVVRGINLLALIEQTVQVGSARLEITGRCHPCSRMEKVLGPGGYNAMRGHGGITARVLEAGVIRIGDRLLLDKS